MARRDRLEARPADAAVARLPAPLGRLAAPVVTAGRFLYLVAAQAHRDALFLTASALAYISILSLIPLLVASSFIGERLFVAYREHLVETFSGFAPYAEQPLVDLLSDFLAQAESLRGLALLLFISTAVFLFATVEETLNRIWKVARRRSLRLKIVSFLLLVFWGPVAVGATFTSLGLLRKSPWLHGLLGDLAVWSVLLFLLKLGALAMLYWMVPHTAVRLRHAAAGAAVAAVLLELLGRGFTFYAEIFKSANLVYGSFSFALFFAVSLQLSWTIVLAGSEIAYTAQNFHALARSHERRAPAGSRWAGLAALLTLARRLTAGEPILSRRRLADVLRLTPPELDRALGPLLEQGLLREVHDEESGYLLSRDARRISVEEVFSAYDPVSREALEVLAEDLRGPLLPLCELVQRTQSESLGEVRLADLVAAPDAVDTT